MTAKEDLKRRACAAIEARKPHVIQIAKNILENPETGFNERRTATVVTHELQKMGVPYRGKLARTGIKGRIEGGAGPGPAVGILGELDSLLASEHPFADPTTGAAHACGHHAQIGMMLGAAMGLTAPEVLNALSGAIVPFAVPAEEFVEVERRLALRENGHIEFLGGKQELIRLGEFDDVDIAMMCHTASDMGGRHFSIGSTSNGHLVKFIEYTGRGAHAGSAPHLGINALNAANIAISAIHANRETFRDRDTVRVHGMINRGGDVVSAVPSDVRLEWRVRSSTPEAIIVNSAKVDRCFKAGALAVGAKVRITTIPGYFPLRQDQALQDLFRSNSQELLGSSKVLVMSTSRNRGGSTDMGDLSQIMPVCHPWTGGASGSGHSKNYLVQDYEQAVVNPAKIMAMVVIDLLAEDAQGARRVLASSRPSMTRDQYVSFQRQRATVTDFDGAAE